jgi:hypothetical protein
MAISCRRCCPIRRHFLNGVQVVQQEMVHFAAIAAAQTRSNKLALSAARLQQLHPFSYNC